MIISILNQYIQFRYTLTIIPFDDNCTSFLRKTSKFLPNSFFNIFGPIKIQNVHVIISIFMVIARCSYKIECIFFPFNFNLLFLFLGFLYFSYILLLKNSHNNSQILLQWITSLAGRTKVYVSEKSILFYH